MYFTAAKVGNIFVNTKHFLYFFISRSAQARLGRAQGATCMHPGGERQPPPWGQATIGGARAEPAASEEGRERAERTESTQPPRSKASTRERAKERPTEQSEQGRGRGTGRAPPPASEGTHTRQGAPTPHKHQKRPPGTPHGFFYGLSARNRTAVLPYGRRARRAHQGRVDL